MGAAPVGGGRPRPPPAGEGSTADGQWGRFVPTPIWGVGRAPPQQGGAVFLRDKVSLCPDFIRHWLGSRLRKKPMGSLVKTLNVFCPLEIFVHNINEFLKAAPRNIRLVTSRPLRALQDNYQLLTVLPFICFSFFSLSLSVT